MLCTGGNQPENQMSALMLICVSINISIIVYININFIIKDDDGGTKRTSEVCRPGHG